MRTTSPRPSFTARRVLPPALLASLAVGGCAERQLVAAPATEPGTASWLAVGVAAAAASLLLGVLMALPAWRRDRGRATFPSVVLAWFSGAAALGCTVLVGVAVRSWQLIDRPVEESAAPALLRISAADGDTGFFALMVLTIAVAGGLLVLLLTLAARWSAGDDPTGRAIAAVVLAVVAVAGVASAAMVVGSGSRAWPYLTMTAATPVVIAAFTTSLSRSRRPA